MREAAMTLHHYDTDEEWAKAVRRSDRTCDLKPTWGNFTAPRTKTGGASLLTIGGITLQWWSAGVYAGSDGKWYRVHGGTAITEVQTDG